MEIQKVERNNKTTPGLFTLLLCIRMGTRIGTRRTSLSLDLWSRKYLHRHIEEFLLRVLNLETNLSYGQTATTHTETNQSMELGMGNWTMPTFKCKEKTDNETEGNPVRNEPSKGKNTQH